MDRGPKAPLGFAVLVAFVLGVGFLITHRDGQTATPLLATSSTSVDLDAAAAAPALVWPHDVPGPLADHVGRRVTAFGLKVVSVGSAEGFWVDSGGRQAWVQLDTSTESPQAVHAGDIVSFSGRVTPRDPDFAHFAVRAEALSLGVG